MTAPRSPQPPDRALDQGSSPDRDRWRQRRRRLSGLLVLSSTPGQDPNAAACAAYQIEQPKFSDPKLDNLTPHGPAATFYITESGRLQQIAHLAKAPLQGQLQQLAKMENELGGAINRDDLPAETALAGNNLGVISNIDSTCKSYGH